MGKFRIAAFSTCLALLAGATTMGSATAATATQGVGTSSASSTLAQLDLGNGLLSVRVLGDDGQSTIDPKVSAPSAASVLHPLTVASNTISALNVTAPSVEARSTGNPQSVGSSRDLSTLGVPASIIKGVIDPATLTAAVDAVSARSGLDVALNNLSAASGVVSVDSIASSLGAVAATGDSDGVRGLTASNLKVLNLGALLSGLGLPLTSLNVTQLGNVLQSMSLLGAGSPVNSLLTTLGIAGPINDAADLQTVVSGLTTGLTSDNAALAAVQAAACGTVPGALLAANPALAALGVTAATTCASAITTVTGAIATLTNQLGSLLPGLLHLLDAQSLLSLDSVDVGLATKATDAVSTSVATATGKIGALHIGGITIPGVDLLSSNSALTADAVTNALKGVLGAVDPGLANLLSVKLLDTSGTGVTQSSGYIQALGKLSAVSVAVTPPANLGAILNGLAGPSALSVLTTAIPGFNANTIALPNAAAMSVLNSALTPAGAPAAIRALASGATLDLATIQATSNFAPVIAAAPASPGATLPRTGGTTGLAVVAMVLVGLALVIRRRMIAPSQD